MGKAKKAPKFAVMKKMVTHKAIKQHKEKVLNPNNKKDLTKEKLPRNVIAKDPRFERLPCIHKGTYADDCIVERVTQHKCYIVATCDRDLKRRIRKVPGVPIMYITNHKYSIERLPEATMGGGGENGELTNDEHASHATPSPSSRKSVSTASEKHKAEAPGKTTGGLYNKLFRGSYNEREGPSTHTRIVKVKKASPLKSLD
ncbi:hypothetical protein RND71_029208 [Anisodus tanguticus]|uniref:rRNA-processing protein FCF1 homolog n=1 Tax=Anisodus tanguticus TaxID=243964 RepID=A0AAE1RD02_9SOLA|nr:hypothetical protein RND71_029208 [Anisodus tanguticus]